MSVCLSTDFTRSSSFCPPIRVNPAAVSADSTHGSGNCLSSSHTQFQICLRYRPPCANCSCAILCLSLNRFTSFARFSHVWLIQSSTFSISGCGR
jgi:hypothetical protein